MIPYFTFVLLFVCVEAKDHCPVIPSLHIDAALKIWNYLKIDDQPVKGDIIIALGSHEVRIVKRAAELWHDRYAEYILFSGKSGNLTRGKWKKTEAELFRDVAIAKGVPENRIIIETESTNTGENKRFSFRLLRNRNDLPSNAMLVQKPYMGQRTLATFQEQWPGSKCKIYITSPNINVLDYPNNEVGDLLLLLLVTCREWIAMRNWVIRHFKEYQMMSRQHITFFIVVECIMDTYYNLNRTIMAVA